MLISTYMLCSYNETLLTLVFISTYFNCYFRHLFTQVYYYHSDQLDQRVDTVTSFIGSYTLGDLRPYTVYSVYLTAVTLINGTDELLEGTKSEIISRRTLAGSKYNSFSLTVTFLMGHILL